MTAMGNPTDARWVRLKAPRGVTRTSSWWSKPIRWIYGALTGHGNHPLAAAVWLIAAVVASGLIVATHEGASPQPPQNRAAWKTPPSPGQLAPPITGATPCDELQDRSSCLNPVLYAFDTALPGTLAAGQAAQWTANGARGSNSRRSDPHPAGRAPATNPVRRRAAPPRLRRTGPLVA